MSSTPINRAQTGNSFVNENGHKIHFRIEWKNFKTAKYVIFLIHGYSGHINGPTAHKVMQYMNSRDCIVVAVDMQGHGYSEGDRCLMLKHDDMVSDVLQVVRCFENEDRDKELVFEEHESSFKRSDLATFKKLPFFLMGSSMGGAVSTLSGHAMHAQNDTFPNFKGAILLAPALSFKMPNWFLVETLR